VEALNGNVHGKTGYIHDESYIYPYDNSDIKCFCLLFAKMPHMSTYISAFVNNLTIAKLLFSQISLTKQISNEVSFLTLSLISIPKNVLLCGIIFVDNP
jgi:hypothetical protein